MNWLRLNWPTVFDLFWRHVAVAVPAILLSSLIAIPLGRLAFSRPRLGGPLLGIATLLYAMPALPMLIIIPVIFGVALRSPATMIIALTLYGVALLVRTAADAFASVGATTREAAFAIGDSARSVFWTVDLPLAVPVMLAGLRVMSVSTIGLATIGALTGVKSLGTLMTDGFQRGIVAEVAAGGIATIVLAMVIDAGLVLSGSALTPWLRAARSPRPARGVVV